MRGCWWWRAPFDRLRANGFGRGAFGGEWGMRWGTGVPRAAPLWIPAFAGMTLVGECGKDERWGRPRAAHLPWVPARTGTTMGVVVGCVGARGWCQGGSPLSRAGGSRTAPTTGVGRTRAGVMRGLLVVEGLPSSALRTGFDRLRANGFGRGACGGGVEDARGDGDALRRAPALGSRESENDDGGCGGTRWREGFGPGWVARGPLSRAGGSRTAPTTGVGRARAGVMRGLLVVEGPPSSALRTGFDRLRANGFGMRACDRGVGDAMGDGDALRLAPALGSRESGNDDGPALPAGEGFAG